MEAFRIYGEVILGRIPRRSSLKLLGEGTSVLGIVLQTCEANQPREQIWECYPINRIISVDPRQVSTQPSEQRTPMCRYTSARVVAAGNTDLSRTLPNVTTATCVTHGADVYRTSPTAVTDV